MKISGEKIRTIRENQNLSRSELSRRSKVSIRTLEDWEAGKRNPQNFDLIDSVVKALDVDIIDLYDDEYLSQMNRKALENADKIGELSEAEIELTDIIERIYADQGLVGILRMIDRFIYHIGPGEALEIIKEYENESN